MFTVEINKIVNALITVSEKYFTFEERKKKALEDYRGKALEQNLDTAEGLLKTETKGYVSSMSAAVDRMTEEVKSGNHYDINDSAVANAAALLSNNGMSMDAAEAIIKGFAGNATVLEIIKAASAEEYRPLFKRWCFDNVGALDEIKAAIGKLVYERGENYPAIVSQIREKLTAFAYHQGIDLGKSADQLEEMRMRNIANLAGLSWQEVGK